MSALTMSRFLRYFVEVARAGSIRRSAESLNISASAIDKQILKAEQDIGVPLFDRLPSGLRLTAAGEMVLDLARRWGRDQDQLLTRIEELKGLRRGHVKIAAIEALAKTILPKVLADARKQVPGIISEITILKNLEVESAVISGDADLGLLLAPRTTRTLAVRHHCEMPVGLVCLPSHPAAGKQTVRYSELVEQRWIAPAAPLAICQQLEILRSATGIDLCEVARSDNIQMIKSLVLTGLGVTILVYLDVFDEMKRNELCFVPLSDRILRPINLALCLEPSRALSSAASLIIGRLEAEMNMIQKGFDGSVSGNWTDG